MNFPVQKKILPALTRSAEFLFEDFQELVVKGNAFFRVCVSLRERGESVSRVEIEEERIVFTLKVKNAPSGHVLNIVYLIQRKFHQIIAGYSAFRARHRGAVFAELRYQGRGNRVEVSRFVKIAVSRNYFLGGPADILSVDPQDFVRDRKKSEEIIRLFSTVENQVGDRDALFGKLYGAVF